MILQLRYYDCYIYRKVKGVKGLFRNMNSACWAGLEPAIYSWRRPYCRKTVRLPIATEIYISEFRGISIKYIRQLLKIINKITPCKITKVNNKNYIYYKCINDGCYNPNLILLNIIRMCWYKPKQFKHSQFFIDIFNFKDEDDPLLFLTTLLRDNVEVVPKGQYACYGDHSNIHKNIIPKPTNYLIDYHSKGTRNFLTDTLDKFIKK